MKRILALMLVCIICVSLCACGKSKEAQVADELIMAIGELSVDAIEGIIAAQEYYDNLADQHKEQVENYNILEAAVAVLPELQQEKAYLEAMVYYEQEEYEAALVILKELGEYKDAKSVATKCEQFLSPMYILMEYLSKESVYLAEYQQNGVPFTYNNGTISLVLIVDQDKLNVYFELGEPCIDWKSMELEEFADRRQYLDDVVVYKIGSDNFNHAIVNLKIQPRYGTASAYVEYITAQTFWYGISLHTCYGTGSMICSDYNYQSNFSYGAGFNAHPTEITDVGNELMAVVLQYFSMAVKDCGFDYSLKDLGWQKIG